MEKEQYARIVQLVSESWYLILLGSNRTVILLQGEDSLEQTGGGFALSDKELKQREKKALKEKERERIAQEKEQKERERREKEEEKKLRRQTKTLEKLQAKEQAAAAKAANRISLPADASQYLRTPTPANFLNLEIHGELKQRQQVLL